MFGGGEIKERNRGSGGDDSFTSDFIHALLLVLLLLRLRPRLQILDINIIDIINRSTTYNSLSSTSPLFPSAKTKSIYFVFD